jgi:Predicted integral membrane protein
VVLPFANLSPDPDNAYFGDGLMEEVIADLSRVRALTVISRTSSVKLKETGWDLRRIGRELNVRYALEGSVRREGPALRITAQLIDVETDVHLWAEKYGGTVDDVFDLQERLSRQIVEALQITLSQPEDREIAERPIADLRAFEYYQRARQEYYRYTAKEWRRPERWRNTGSPWWALMRRCMGCWAPCTRGRRWCSPATRRPPCGKRRPVPAEPSS